MLTWRRARAAYRTLGPRMVDRNTRPVQPPAQVYLDQRWGKIRPIRIRIRIREYSANLSFEKVCIIRRIQFRILKLKFEFA
jgi:hypothetical protein